MKFPEYRPKRGYNVGLEGTGRLVFKIESYLRAIGQRVFEESDKSGVIEDKLDQVANWLIEACELKGVEAEQDKIREETRRIEAEAREQRRLAKKRDQDQWHEMTVAAQQWSQRQSLLVFAETLRANAGEMDEIPGERSIGDWLTWIDNKLQESDPLRDGPAGLFRRLSAGTPVNGG